MREEESMVAVVAIVFGAPMLVIIAGMLIRGLVQIVCHWRDVSLKIRLADRGMSAYEIEHVVQAGRESRCSRRKSRAQAIETPAKPPKAAYAVRP